jgi:hypothetical protein
MMDGCVVAATLCSSSLDIMVAAQPVRDAGSFLLIWSLQAATPQ